MAYYSSASVRYKDETKKWYVRLSYKDAFGKWKGTERLLKDAKTKKEAKRQAEELRLALNNEAQNTPNTPTGETLDSVIRDYLEKQYKKGEIEKSTYSNALYFHKKYTEPYIGDYIFNTIDKNVLNKWITDLYNLGLSQNTIHTTFARVKKVYNYYLDIGEITLDPFKGVKTPKKGKPKTTHLTAEQMENFLARLYDEYEESDAFFVGVLLAYYAGLRRGEICGLRWNDIDFINKTITVRSAVGVSEGLGNYTKSPKNESSNRTFPLIPQLEEALKIRKQAIKPKENWFVIGKEEKFMRPQQFNRQFAEFVERNNLVDAYGKKIMPHGLRHNFATLGIKSGVDIASLALMMGHASRSITLDVYGDANADALQLASNKLAVSFRDETKFELGEEVETALEEKREKLDK